MLWPASRAWLLPCHCRHRLMRFDHFIKLFEYCNITLQLSLQFETVQWQKPSAKVKLLRLNVSENKTKKYDEQIIWSMFIAHHSSYNKSKALNPTQKYCMNNNKIVQNTYSTLSSCHNKQHIFAYVTHNHISFIQNPFFPFANIITLKWYNQNPLSNTPNFQH